MRLSNLFVATALTTVLFMAESAADAQSANTALPQSPPAGSLTSPAATIDDESTQVGSANDQDDVILITGSRIPVRNTIDAAVPVQTVTATELLGARGDISLGDALNQLPQLRSTFSQANSTGSIGTAGLSLLDLRGLGTARTLTLVNGRRVVSAVPGSYTPDVNTIPFDLVESVELVTGGNSAIYGSDAVAGVVNFRLRRDFEGVRFRGQAGVTQYGDRPSYLLSGVAGRNFLDSRVNVTVSGEYSNSEALFYRDRDYLGAEDGPQGWVVSQITNAPNRNFDGIPNTAFVRAGGIRRADRSLGGMVITNCPAATAANLAQRNAICTGQLTPAGARISDNYAFLSDGSLVRNGANVGVVDQRNLGGGVLGGLGATAIEDAMLLPGNERVIGNVLLNGDFSTAFRPFAELSYVRVRVSQQSVQPSFNGTSLSTAMNVNNPFLTDQARATLATILAPGQQTFNLNRFNNDFGTRAEFHTRETYRGVIGVSGNIAPNIRYEVAGNYGRTENFYRTGGNVLVQNHNRAINAVLAPASFSGSNFLLNQRGQRVICGINASANVDANCVPLNLFGFGSPDQRALDYILHTSTRNQWAEQINATAFVAGTTEAFFNLPAGPIGFSIGGEYRREDAFSGQDEITNSGLTFLNPAATFDPDAVNIKEAFGELRIPLLRDQAFFHELTAEGAGRVSDYGGTTGSVWAWNAGLIYAPVRDFRVRGTYSRSVRAPNLSNLFASSSQTFANSFTDPCDQPGGNNAGNNITTNPNRVANCAAAGIPTTITFADPTTGEIITRPWTNQTSSGVAGVNRGNPDLVPEVGNSFTVGAVLTPTALAGFSFTVDYYNIRVDDVISGLSGQAIINRCYDDPGGLDNPFCAVVFRRTSGDPAANFAFLGQGNRVLDNRQINIGTSGDGVAFINQPFNFARLQTRGIDFDAAYRHRFSEGFGLNLRLIVSHVMDRLSYSYITEPDRFDRIDQTLGDPRWQGQFTASVDAKPFDLTYNLRYVGKQIFSDLSYETFFSSQGRPALNPDARPEIFMSPVTYHNLRVGLDISDRHRFYFGVDNLTNQLPPWEQTGLGNGAIYPNVGRFFYAGFEARL